MIDFDSSCYRNYKDSAHTTGVHLLIDILSAWERKSYTILFVSRCVTFKVMDNRNRLFIIMGLGLSRCASSIRKLSSIKSIASPFISVYFLISLQADLMESLSTPGYVDKRVTNCCTLKCPSQANEIM